MGGRDILLCEASLKCLELFGSRFQPSLHENGELGVSHTQTTLIEQKAWTGTRSAFRCSSPSSVWRARSRKPWAISGTICHIPRRIAPFYCVFTFLPRSRRSCLMPLRYAKNQRAKRVFGEVLASGATLTVDDKRLIQKTQIIVDHIAITRLGHRQQRTLMMPSFSDQTSQMHSGKATAGYTAKNHCHRPCAFCAEQKSHGEDNFTQIYPTAPPVWRKPWWCYGKKAVNQGRSPLKRICRFTSTNHRQKSSIFTE